MPNIKVTELNYAIRNALNDYNADVIKELKKVTEKSAKELVTETKATAPVGRRKSHYKDYIASRTLEESNYGITKMWYVKSPEYRLTHLLNNGHALKGGGRYPGTNFLGKAVDKIVPKFVEKVEAILKHD